MQKKSKIFILDTNKISRDILKSFFDELNLEQDLVFHDDYSKGIEEIKDFNENPIVIINLTEDYIKFKNIIETIKLYSTKIVITSTDYSTNMIVRALRLGAREFLPKPIIKEELRATIERLSTEEDNEYNTVSKIITIFSNKGGIGKTTLATNLAYELAKNSHNKVALIDLNLQLGDISTFLNLEPTFDVAYVIKKLVEKKDENILSAFEKYKDSNLYVLSDPTFIEQSESITPQEIEALLKSLKHVFPYIIIDMSSSIDPVSLKILDKSDLILFTTIVNIPAIRNTQRCLTLFDSRRYPKEKVNIIINRYIETDEIKIEDIESTLGKKIYWKIPNNYFSVMESINKGVPVSNVNANSNIAHSFSDLASQIADDIITQTILKYRDKNLL